jgi:hypothetical protein
MYSIVLQNTKFVFMQIPLDEVDIAHLLPIFFEGLAEVEYPYEFIAKAGIADMVNKSGQKLLPVLPFLIPPLRRKFTQHIYILDFKF